MRITGESTPEPVQQVQDLTPIFLTLQKEHGTVYFHQIENQIFFYRPLGRNEYKDLVNNEEFNDFQKEEIVCEACTLWPEGFDFADCDEAGTPTVLARTILKNSFLDSIESRIAILSHCREEMFDLDNQITCIINEAFPQFDIEEIEKWDVAKTAKYLSRAEWKLQNLRGMNMIADPFVMPQEQAELPPQQQRTPMTQEVEDSPLKRGETETLAERQRRLAGQSSKQRMTPEKLAELKARFPEMEWGDNALEAVTVDGLQDSVDVTSPALRPGF